MKVIDWREAEKIAARELEKEFKQKFLPRKIKAGNLTPRVDLVSEDGKIISQVKSCRKKFEELTNPQIETRFKRDYFFDCYLLGKISAKKRIFFLAADKSLFDEFEKKFKGLISKRVDLRFINAWRRRGD